MSTTRDPNYRTNPMIQLAKQACDELNGVIAFVVVLDGEGVMSGHSYGRTRKLCDIGGKLLDEAMDALSDGAGRLE